jgi:glucose-6-phosphate isomerase
MTSAEWTERNKNYEFTDGESGFTLNVAGMNFTENDLGQLSAKFANAHSEMKKIEAGEIKNPDENRKVTHFTDRMAYPSSQLFADVEKFVEDVRSGVIKGSTGKNLDSVVINGIGGSALGPQFLQFAINGPYWNELGRGKRKGYLKIYFTDNTDTAGVSDVMKAVNLKSTLVLSISKSGGTQETKNNTIAFEKIYREAGLDFTKHACAITMEGSELDKYSKSNNWLKVFPMAESIGGRTSETSVVGHLPAALTGIDFRSFIAGACRMDTLTREANVKKNPSYLLAAMWHIAGNGRGDKNMVIVPYSDRLVLLSRYLQQLVMESIGKEKDLDGNIVNQGLNVFGNKGGTDAHAFIQQLNDGKNDFFVTFIEVLKDSMNIPITENISMGDYLHGFKAGLANALRSKGRQVVEMQITDVNAFNLGMIIALYERAVAFYAELVHINAFHQPGVQSYKLASKEIISLQIAIEGKLANIGKFKGPSHELAAKIGLPEQEIDVAGLIAKFAENEKKRKFPGFKISRAWNGNDWIYSVKGNLSQSV